jgi:hypothetical protein
VLANNGRGFDVFGAERTGTLPCGRSGRARLLDHDLRPWITDGHSQCNNPPDQGPSEEQVYDEYGAGIGLLPGGHCREEDDDKKGGTLEHIVRGQKSKAFSDECHRPKAENAVGAEWLPAISAARPDPGSGASHRVGWARPARAVVVTKARHGRRA